MEIIIIHGQMHKGSTYHITEQLKDKLCNNDTLVHEFFLPKDMSEYCIGCFNCINKGEALCPHHKSVGKIVQAVEKSDIIIIDSPTYCFSMTGQLKTLFDHLAFMWMPHRPNGAMFHKTGIAVSSAAGSGAGKVTKAIQEQLFWMGVSKSHRLSFSVNASSWEEVPLRIKDKIEKVTDQTAKKALKIGKSSLKMKFIFSIMRLSQKSNQWNIADKNHWIENGWLKKERPWRN